MAHALQLLALLSLLGSAYMLGSRRRRRRGGWRRRNVFTGTNPPTGMPLTCLTTEACSSNAGRGGLSEAVGFPRTRHHGRSSGWLTRSGYVTGVPGGSGLPRRGSAGSGSAV